MNNRRSAILVALSGMTTSFAATKPNLTITNITGYSDGVGVSSGRWTGQPMAKPKSNAFVNFFVLAAPSNPSLNVTSGDTYTWNINGKNFGTTKGSVWLLDALMKDIPGVTIKINSWTDTKIVVVANAPFTFKSRSDTSLWVSKLATRPAPASHPDWSNIECKVVGIIQSRGHGQCTWFVAMTRLSQGLRIPPSAYSNSAQLSGIGGTDNYTPTQWDALTYGSGHVAIISSSVTKTPTANGSITFSFTVSEMNALTDEATSTSQRQYVISAPNSKGQRTVVQMIGSNAGRMYVATGYYR